MNRFLITLLSLITGVFALIFSLLLTIPLTIAALITGKRLEKQLKTRAFQFKSSATYQPHANVIEGECEEISPRR
ncbi:hypothetical protein IG517_13160 [Vibrio cholerae]|uniref:hypothetical protein n=1 Tax=Vibrio cholerae TaxID=666 RepID=UPI00028D8E07|nr:hypothetical protein [Vibrio cholerae]AOY45640.1 hypothetical protein NH62_10417 [Vibrio cholerae]AOY49247.1 hypothetical protein AP033_10420 [Vibrio cholerae]EII3726682.1 hypothetical protein [Vibrio cholerae]EKG74574.1 hypothetical protein VCCP103710_3684 [Vibrio cholerae CP1037(10)]MBJ6893086.1 hypothetical protein [Vibrio cholerae]